MFGFFEPDVPTVSADGVQQAIEKQEKAIILDVRTFGEHAQNRIKGSINLPVNDIAHRVESIITDKKQKVYVYCLSGSRSVVAVDDMRKFGYTNVFNIKSGLLAWRDKLPTTLRSGI